MVKQVIKFFDKLEDWVRAGLSRSPVIYSLVGAVGIILVWKGVWETAEHIPGLWGPGSIVMGVIILLASGLLVSFFIGDNIIMSGLRREKKAVEKSEKELLEAEKAATASIISRLDHIEEDLHRLAGEEVAREDTRPLPLK